MTPLDPGDVVETAADPTVTYLSMTNN